MEMYVKLEGKTVRIQFPRWLLLSFGTTVCAFFGHVGKTYLDFADLRGKYTACEQRVSELEKRIEGYIPQIMPGPASHQGGGAPR